MYHLLSFPVFVKKIFSPQEQQKHKSKLNGLKANTEQECVYLLDKDYLEYLLSLCTENDDRDGDVTLRALDVLVNLSINMPFLNVSTDDGKKFLTKMEQIDGYLRLLRLFYRCKTKAAKEKIVIILACFHVWRPLGKWFLVIIPMLKDMLYDLKEDSSVSLSPSEGRSPGSRKYGYLDNIMDGFNRLSFEPINEDILIAYDVVPHYLHHPLFLEEDSYFVQTTVTLMYNLSFTQTDEMKDKMIRGGIFSSFYTFLNMATKKPNLESSTPQTRSPSPSKSFSILQSHNEKEKKSHSTPTQDKGGHHGLSLDYELIRSVCAAIRRLTVNNTFAIKSVLDLGMINPLAAVLKLTIESSPDGVSLLYSGGGGGGIEIEKGGEYNKPFNISYSDKSSALADRTTQDKKETVKNIITILANCTQYGDHSKPLVDGGALEQGVKMLQQVLTVPLKDVSKYVLQKIIKILVHIAAGGSQRPKANNHNRYFKLFNQYGGVDSLLKFFDVVSSFMSQLPPSALLSPTLGPRFDVPVSPHLTVSGHSTSGAHSFTGSMALGDSLAQSQSSSSKWEEIKKRVALCYCFLMHGQMLTSKSRNVLVYIESSRSIYSPPSHDASSEPSQNQTPTNTPSKEIVKPRADYGPSLTDDDWNVQVAFAWNGLQGVSTVLDT
jgi:hypothetical protein